MSKIVLTVDDPRTMRDMLRLALTQAGHHVVQAAGWIVKPFNPETLIDAVRRVTA